MAVSKTENCKKPTFLVSCVIVLYIIKLREDRTGWMKNSFNNYSLIKTEYHNNCISDEFYNHTKHNMPVTTFFRRRSAMTTVTPKDGL